MTDTQQSAQTAPPVSVPVEIAAAAKIDTAAPGASGVVPAPAQFNVPAKTDFASFQAQYLNGYIGLADTKAAWVFAIPAAAIAYLAAQPEVWSLIRTTGHGWSKALASVVLLLLAFSAAAAFGVIVPRLSGEARGLVYFGAVASRKSADAYVSDLAPLSGEALLDARLRHNFEIARVCRSKYAALRLAMWTGFAGLIAMLALVAVLKAPPAAQSQKPPMNSRGAPDVAANKQSAATNG